MKFPNLTKRTRFWRTGFALVTAGTLMLAACGPADEVATEAPPVDETESVEVVTEEVEVEQEAFPSYDPVTVLIPEEPWFSAMKKLADVYEDETGNVVNLSVTPFQGMVQKSINSIQAPESEFDIIVLNEALYPMFYASQWVVPFNDIDPDFELDPEIISYENAARWDPELGVSTGDGAIYGIPINGNVQLLFYRADLFEEHGIPAPETWADVEEAATILHDPPNIYGFASRTNPPNISTQAFIKGYGGSLLDYEMDSGNWVIRVNEDVAVEAIEEWLRLTETFGPPNYQSISQAEMMTLMASGKLAQGVMISSVAEDLDNPDISIVSGDVAATVAPGPTADQKAAITGIWMLIIPHNTIDENQPGALAFIDWATAKEAQLIFAQEGGTPIREDVYEELKDDPQLGWWMTAILDTIPYMYSLPRTPHIMAVLTPYISTLSQMVVGEFTPEEALNQIAETMYISLSEANVPLQPLNE